WIFSSDVIARGEAAPGDVVQVLDHKGRAMGVAHYSSSSQICLRLLSSRIELVDFERRISAALDHRRAVVCDTDAYRLVHAEADALPALIVDRYGDYLSVQTLNQGMDRAKDMIVAALVKLLAPKGIVLRNDASVRRKEELPQEIVVAYGE